MRMDPRHNVWHRTRNGSATSYGVVECNLSWDAASDLVRELYESGSARGYDCDFVVATTSCESGPEAFTTFSIDRMLNQDSRERMWNVVSHPLLPLLFPELRSAGIWHRVPDDDGGVWSIAPTVAFMRTHDLPWEIAHLCDGKPAEIVCGASTPEEARVLVDNVRSGRLVPVDAPLDDVVR